MITKVNPYGHISLTNDYFSGLVEQAARQCYGIAAMGQAPAESVVRNALRTGSLWVGVLMGAVAGMLSSLIVAVWSVLFRQDQSIVGIMFNILATGFTNFLNRMIFGTSNANISIDTFQPIAIPGLSKIPVLGEIFFNQDILAYLSVVLAAAVFFVLRRTKLGLQLGAVGENPRAAQAAGLSDLCATDHCDLLNGEGRFAPDFDWPAALAQMAQAREGLTGRLQLRLGLELGSAPFDPAAARKLLTGAGEALDFVLGSLHNWVGAEENIDFYYTDFSGDPARCRRALENALDSTWALVTDCPDCYDSLAHIVYPLRYMARDGQALSLADYEERVRDIFTQVARTDHALEVNTNRGRDLAASKVAAISVG